MITPELASAANRVALAHGMEAAGLKAFIDVESAGLAYAVVDGRNEPLIRWEGHYFYRLCADLVRDRAVAAGLASAKAGGVKNPASQQGRWDRLLKPAMALDVQAALESCSWGLGQVMGSHWKMLGFSSVIEMVETARSDIEGQIELIAQFIEKSGLKGALAAHDWKTVALGYNGFGYAKNSYDTKMAAAYKSYAGPDGAVLAIQKRLVAHGFSVTIDGIRGVKTTAAIIAFQKAKGLKPDGIVGRLTMAALNGDPA